MISVACVVEGHGEVEALPVLLRRMAEECGVAIRVRRPHRVPRSKPWADWARAVVLQQSALPDSGGVVVVLIDSDDDDPKTIETQIAREVRALSNRNDSIICVAVREYEAWFLAAIEGLRSHQLIKNDADFSGDPDAIRNAKGALSSLMNSSYSEVLHQPKFSAVMDLQAARHRSNSFQRFYSSVSSAFSGDLPSRPGPTG